MVVGNFNANSRGAAFFGTPYKASRADVSGTLIAPQDAHDIIKTHPKARIRRQAGNIRANMERNNEVLLNGTIPGTIRAN